MGDGYNSRSQLTENFISSKCHFKQIGAIDSIDRGQFGEPPLPRNHRIGSRELFQKAQIVLCKESDIWNVEQNHRQTIHTETECIAAPLFRIVSVIAALFVDRFKNGRMHDAATG